MKLLWVRPEVCTPPHRVAHRAFRDSLVPEFRWAGWDRRRQPLVGYPDGTGIQLLTGSHRWDAAVRADIRIPVVVHSRETVAALWGDVVSWRALLDAVPTVEALETGHA
jgi:hypothetical protein